MSWRPGPDDTQIRLMVRRLMALAALAISWERLWPAMWPAVSVAGLFVALALLDVMPLMPGWLHAVLLLGFAAAFAWMLTRGVRDLHLPTESEARRRLETASQLSHRPLVALDDVMVAGYGDDQSEALWRVHRGRAIAALKRLRVGVPTPGLARRDPRALRFAVALALVVGVVAAGSEWLPRLARAVTPDLSQVASIVPATFEVWVTPPDYTGLAPLFLDAEMFPEDGPTVPSGSVIMAQVHDGRGTASLAFGPGNRHDLTAVDDRTWRADVPVEVMEPTKYQLTLSQGVTELGSWPILVVPDEAPTVDHARPPEATVRAVLRLEYVATDDYGLESVIARILRPEGEAANDDPPIEISLPLPGRGLKTAQAASYSDLTAHPWAGLPVEIELEARDGPGQAGRSERFAMVLPERQFTHPVAKAIIEQRKRLTREPSARVPIAGGIATIAIEPEAFDNDLVVYLALMTAKSRLMRGRSEDTVREVQQLLWDTALRVEEGNMALADRDLRNLQRQLMEALANDAPEEEIERLMERLRDAIDRFMQALAENMMRQLEDGAEMQPIDPNAMTLTRRDLQDMIDRMQEMSRTGAREAARQLLSQLQEMLENLRSAPMMAMRQMQNSEAGQLMRGMEDLIRRQQSLLDRTYRSARRSRDQQGQPGQQPQQGAGDTPRPGDQEALRRMLGDIMRRLGEMGGDIPRGLGRAERFMRDSSRALGEGQPENAVGPQTNALDEMQQGAQSMMQQLIGRPGNEFGLGNRFGRSDQLEPNVDPFGRTAEEGGWWDNGDVLVPDKADLQRARQILDELRRRAGQRIRPMLELDYIDRLLRRF